MTRIAFRTDSDIAQRTNVTKVAMTEHDFKRYDLGDMFLC